MILLINSKYLEYGTLILVTYAVTMLIIYLTKRFLTKEILQHTEADEDSTTLIFIKNSLNFILYSIATFWIFYKIPYFKSLGTTLFAGAGILVAVIGFASQKAMSNIIGGIFILIFKPFKINDVIEVSNARKGTVEEITLKHTVIRDFENRRVIIPNAMLNDEVIVNSNITDEKIRKHIEFGISYDSDINLATEIIQREVEAHPLNIDNRSAEDIAKGVPKVMVRLISLSDSSVVIKAYAWAKNFDDAFVMNCDVLKSVKFAFDENGIEIPFPHRTIVMKTNKDELPNQKDASN